MPDTCVAKSRFNGGTLKEREEEGRVFLLSEPTADQRDWQRTGGGSGGPFLPLPSSVPSFLPEPEHDGRQREEAAVT